MGPSLLPECPLTTHTLSRLVPVLAVLMWIAPAARSQPPAERKPNPPLRVVPIDLDLSDPKRQVDPVAFLEPADPYGDGKMEFPTGLLRRELYRQALHLAARD